MNKLLKIWLWVLIVSFSLSFVGEFIFVNGMLGLLYACFNVASIFAVVSLFKSHIGGAYAFLAIRVVETAITFICNSALVATSPWITELTAGVGINFGVLCIVIAVVRLVSAVGTLIAAKKA